MTQAFTASPIHDYVQDAINRRWDNFFKNDPEELQALYRLTPDRLNMQQMTAIFALKNKCSVMFIRDESIVNRSDEFNSAEIAKMDASRQELAKEAHKTIKSMIFPYKVAIDATDFSNLMGVDGDIKIHIKNWKRDFLKDDDLTMPQNNGLILSKDHRISDIRESFALTVGFGKNRGVVDIDHPSKVELQPFCYKSGDNILIDPERRSGREFQSVRTFITIDGVYKLAKHLFRESNLERSRTMDDKLKRQITLYNTYLQNMAQFASIMPETITGIVQRYVLNNMHSDTVLMTMNQEQLIEMIREMNSRLERTERKLDESNMNHTITHQKLDDANHKLDDANHKLDDANHKLDDANRSLKSMKGSIEFIKDYLRLIRPDNTDSYGIMIRFDKLKPSPNDPGKNIKYRLTFQVGLDRRIHEAYYSAKKKDKPRFIGTYLGLDNHQTIFDKLVKENKLRNMKEKPHSGKRFIIPNRGILDKVVQKLSSIVQIKEQVENKMAVSLDPEPDEIVELMSCQSDSESDSGNEKDGDSFEEFKLPNLIGYLHILICTKRNNFKIYFNGEQNPEFINTIKHSKYHKIEVYTAGFDILTWFKFTISSTFEVSVNKTKDAIMVRNSLELFDRLLRITTA